MQAGASSIAAYDDGEKHVPFLQRHVVGPARFLIFLLSLALLAHRDDKELSQSRQHGRRRRKKRRCRITKRESSRSRQIKADKGYASDSAASDSSVGSSTKKRVLHTHQRKLGLLELQDALLAEETLLPILFRMLLGGTVIFVLAFIRACYCQQ